MDQGRKPHLGGTPHPYPLKRTSPDFSRGGNKHFPFSYSTIGISQCPRTPSFEEVINVKTETLTILDQGREMVDPEGPLGCCRVFIIPIKHL